MDICGVQEKTRGCSAVCLTCGRAEHCEVLINEGPAFKSSLMMNEQELSKPDSTFFRRWKWLSLFNLLLVALAGVLLRAKILFPIPWIDHKFLLHAHSHFAFNGWLTQILSIAILELIGRSVVFNRKTVRGLFILNAVASYGMLFTFPFMGYAGLSIFFSSLSLVYAIWFSVISFKLLARADLSRLTSNCIRVALASLVLSTAGPLLLAYVMASKLVTSDLEVRAVYWFLHFQYNGFFQFGVFALYCSGVRSDAPGVKMLNRAMALFTVALVPAYLLSIQWLVLSVPLQALATFAGATQIVALVLVLRFITQGNLNAKSGYDQLAFLAFALKIIFQFLSVFPSLGKIAFGFRPIVIAYLHLVLLGFLSIYMLSYLQRTMDGWTSGTRRGLAVFVGGIVINEFLLFFQGLRAISGFQVPAINYLLLGASIILGAGMLWMVLSLARKEAI